MLRRERAFSSFSRSFTLPENVKEDQVLANLNAGVLEVTVPKVRRKHSMSARVLKSAPFRSARARLQPRSPLHAHPKPKLPRVNFGLLKAPSSTTHIHTQVSPPPKAEAKRIKVNEMAAEGQGAAPKITQG